MVDRGVDLRKNLAFGQERLKDFNRVPKATLKISVP